MSFTDASDVRIEERLLVRVYPDPDAKAREEPTGVFVASATSSLLTGATLRAEDGELVDRDDPRFAALEAESRRRMREGQPFPD